MRCQGVADEAVVTVKLTAEEGMVTYRRIKLAESDREVGGEGRNRKLVNLAITTHGREGFGSVKDHSP